ncbi:hypothetical protein FRC10_001094 [Ceratobasidium sp. 414]|nr:hypothetical protein FRC10_001094 [Ceratobasidium sp. 414]
MSQTNNSIRSLPSPPPTAAVASNRPNFNARSPGLESRPLSTVSPPHAAGAAPAYENPGPGTPSRENQTNVVHTYSAFVSNTMVDVVIRIHTPKESRDSTLTLTCQAGGIERIIGEPQTLQLPRPSQAEFAIYPLNALHKLRIWLTAPELQVRLWAEDE